MIWNGCGDGSFFAEAEDCYIRFDPATPAEGVVLQAASSRPSSSEELDRSRRFGRAEFRRYEWDQPYTTAAYREVLLTYSGHRDMDPAAQAALLECITRLIDTPRRPHHQAVPDRAPHRPPSGPGR